MYICATLPHTLCSFPQAFTQSVGAHYRTHVTQWLVRQLLEVHLKWGDHAGLTRWTTVPPSGGMMNHRMDRTQEEQPRKETGGLLLLVRGELLTTFMVLAHVNLVIAI